MDFGEVLSSTWNVAWRHKYLWVLGLFALTLDGCGSGPSSSFDLGDADLAQFDSGSFPDIFSGNLGLWLALAALALAVGLVLFVVSVISAAGLIAGADDADAGRPGRGIGRAWRRGVSRFWPLLGLLLLVAAVAFVLFLLVAIAVGVPAVLLIMRGTPSIAAIAAMAVAAIVIGLAFLALGVVAQIVLSWSFRSLVLDSTGVFSSLGRGWRLFRENLGSSILVWAVAFGLQLAIALAVGIPLVALLVPGLLAFGFLDGLESAVLPAVLILVPLAVLFGLLLKAFGTTFFTAYWTIAYRRLVGARAAGEGAPPAQAAVPPEATRS